MKTTRHATYNLNYHIVWLPKYRGPVLVNEVKDRARRILHEIAAEKGLEIIDLTDQSDHVLTRRSVNRERQEDTLLSSAADVD